MTLSELAKIIGQTGTVPFGELLVLVRITDAKISYGNARYQVTPVSGTGSVWVDASRVKIQLEVQQ